MMNKYDVLKMKTCVLNIDCVCEGCKRKIRLLLQKVDGVYTVFIDADGGRVKVTGNFDTHYLTKKLEKSAKCSNMIEAEKSSHSVKSAALSERSQSRNSKAGGSHRSQYSVKSGGEAQSHNGSKALTSASMDNKSVKSLDLTDLESKRSGKSRVSENGGGKNGGLFFGLGKFFGFGKNGGEKGPKPCFKKSHSERGGESVHGGSIKTGSSRIDDFHGSEVAHSTAGNSSVGRSSRGGSKKGSKRGPMSHHSGENRSQMGDPYNLQDLPMTRMMNQQRGAYDDAPHRPMSPPPRHRESYEHYFSDENANACNIL